MKITPNLKQTPESQTPLNEESEGRRRRVEIFFWLLAIVLGFFHIWANHHHLINADAMSYLDVAEAYRRGDWSTAVNAYWSPLYSWLIALTLSIVDPSPYWKFAVLHVLNFVIYVFALGSFSLLIRELVQWNRSQRNEIPGPRVVTLPDWALMALGYSLFIWSSLFLVTVSLESPDMLVASLLFLASAIVLRMRRQPSRWLPFFLLGLVLGFGYLAKSVMLPVAAVFMILPFLAIGNLRQAFPRILITMALFLLIATPFVVAISRNKGRFTAGESGRLNYLWAINRIPYFHWQGDPPGFGVLEHPTRKIFDSPPAFEFGEPVAGTFPVWYDPTYWYDGSAGRFDLKRQLLVFVEAAKRYYELFHIWGLQYCLLGGLLILYLMGRRRRLLLNDLGQQWSLIIPALAGMGLYSAISVQGRYVAPFLLLLWLALFSAVRLHQNSESEKLVRVVSLVLVIVTIFPSVASSGGEAIATVRYLVAGEDPLEHEQWQVAEGLREMGLISNDKVAFIGDSFRAFWAHLLGLRIVAEVPKDRTAEFWEADPMRQGELINAFARTGVKAIVSVKPAGNELRGWQKIRNTTYYVYVLN